MPKALYLAAAAAILGPALPAEAQSATFEQGAPLTLEYGATSGAADIAGVIDSGASALATLRDADLAELNRQVDRAKALKELEDLLADR